MNGPSATLPDPAGRRLHPVPLRIMHWVNAIAVIVMIGSGLRIYNDEPIIGGLTFPSAYTFGGDPDVAFQLHGNGASGALLWHFAMMWVLAFNGLAYLAYGTITGRFRRMLFPVRPGEVLHEVGRALRFDLKHEDLTVYNAVQRLLYLGVIAVAVLQVLTGLAIWKPVQLQELTALFGGFQASRLWHFIGTAMIVGFLAVHVALALLVPRTLLAMFTGGPRLARGGPVPGAQAHPHQQPAE